MTASGSLPDGEAYYAYLLRLNTTTAMSPNEVHELGLREVARIEGEMRAMLDANGFAGQPIGQAMVSLGKDPRFLYPNDETGRKAALADYQRLIDDAIRRCRAVVSAPRRERSAKSSACRHSRRRPRRAPTTRARRWMGRVPASSTPTCAT